MSIIVKRTKIIEEPAKEGEFVTKFKLHQRVNVIDRRKNILKALP